MDESWRTLKPWLVFAGIVLIGVVLYWAQAILVPTVLAALLAFVLSPAVTWLERRIGRVAAVLVAVALVFGIFAVASWGLVVQFDHFAEDLPSYRANILAKISDVRGAGKSGSVAKVEATVEDIRTKLAESEKPKAAVPPPSVVVPSKPMPGVFDLGWIGPFVGPLGIAGFVLTMLIFILLERRDLRDRLIGLIGHGHLALTTKALDEAGSRVSRQLSMQFLINLLYGIAIGGGLLILGVPYALAWGGLAAALRLIPYVGSFVAAGGTILASLAALPGWESALWVVALFVTVELITTFVLETRIYAGAAGVSQTALLLSVAFWAWLWGPLGLLMATPLTVCLVVLGRHVPGLEFLGTLMADSPALTPEDGYYQRLLARDLFEAAQLVDEHIKAGPARSVYDALLLPALNYAQRDRLEHRLSAEDEAGLIDATRDLTMDAAEGIRRQELRLAAADATPPAVQGDPLRVIGYPSNDISAAALGMLARLLSDTPVVMEVTSARMLPSELVSLIQKEQTSVVCIADLPPNAPSKSLYLIKRLRAASADVRIVVGRWAPPGLSDDRPLALKDAGATVVCSTFAETTSYLRELAALPHPMPS